MLGSITGMFNKIKDNKLVQNITGNITDNYAKLRDQVLRKYEIVEILPQIYHVSFPQSENIAQLKAHIGKSEFQIWNISEYRYEVKVESELLQVPEQGEIKHLCYSMYSNLPFYELVLALNTIHSFIRCNKTNHVYVHCQDNRVRSAILLACYIYKHKVEGIEDISEAILFVNKALKVSLQQYSKTEMHKNLHLLFKNFVNYQNNRHIINQNKLSLLKIIINNPPLLQISHKNIAISNHMRICVEVRCGEVTLLKNNYNGEEIEGNLMCVSLEKVKVHLGDEFLVIVKYLLEGKAYNILRVQLNTNFIYQGFARVHEQNIDTSSYAQLDPQNILHIDFMFEELSELSKLAMFERDENRQPVELPSEAKNEEKKQQAAKKRTELESERAHSEAIACLNQVTSELAQQHPGSIDLMQHQINQKIISAMNSLPESQQRESSQPSQEQDLDDYLSKLQSQA